MCGLQWLHLFEEKHYWCPCVHIAPWFWPRQEHFLVSASSLTIWTSSFLYFVWTWGSISSERSDYELILLQHEEHYLYIQESCSFPHMPHNSHVFYIEHRLPLPYTCSFTQRPKPSGGKGAKSLLKRQRDSAFVSEWAHLRRRKRDWQSENTYDRSSGTDCLSYIHWASLPLISCKWPLEWRTSRHRHVVVKPSPYRTTQLYFIYKKCF